MRISLIVLIFSLSAATVSAQQRPLVTEDPETIGAGRLLLEAGFDYGSDAIYPASGLEGNLLRVPMIGVSIGVSSIAEIQIDGGLYDRLSITRRFEAPLSGLVTAEGDTTSDVDDVKIGTKIRIASEGLRRPAFGFRFSTKLPNAGNESGIGLDTTDFHFGLAIGKTVQSVRIVGNFGFAILGDPVRGDRQNDVLDYGASVARAVAPGVEVVGELNGRLNTRSGTPPIGTDSQSLMRLGSRFTRGPVRIDGALILGVTERDPSWGFSAGATWVFKAFTVR